jgi:hypothetical protein
MFNFFKKIKEKKPNAKGYIQLSFVFGFIVYVGYLFFQLYSSPKKIEDAKSIKSKIEKLDKKILLTKLNQKAQKLGVKPLHVKYPEIIDYSSTILSQNTKFTNNGNTVILPKNTRLIVLKTKDEDYFYFQKVIINFCFFCESVGVRPLSRG